MSGPVVSIPVRTLLTEDQQSDLRRWIRTIGTLVTSKGKPFADERFWVTHGRAIGLPFAQHEDACPFGLSLETRKPDSAYADETGWIDQRILAESAKEEEHYLRYLGYIPQQEIAVWANCSTPRINHVILGHLALSLAERYDGLIDMCGAITPPLPPGRHTSLENYPWHSLDEIGSFVHQMPGQVFDMYYTTAGDDRWVSHLVDTVFFRAWLQHPHFHMMK